jgi:hypothetical protein
VLALPYDEQSTMGPRTSQKTSSRCMYSFVPTMGGHSTGSPSSPDRVSGEKSALTLIYRLSFERSIKSTIVLPRLAETVLMVKTLE